jgi:DNA-binding MarR family transcriptional regulator
MRPAGLVSQRSDPTDGEARILAVTARGRATVDAAIEIGAAHERALSDELG